MSEDKNDATAVAVAEQKSSALALQDEFLSDITDDGMGDFAQGDFLVPYMRIVQALSKELQKNHAKFLKGAEVGNLINSATRKVWDGDKGVWVIPISFGHRYQAWRPNNGGPADDYGDNDAIYKSIVPNDKGKRVNSDGNEVTDANQYFVFLVDPETGDYEMGVLSMSGSQAKKARQWNSLMANRRERVKGVTKTPPIYYYSYHLTTVAESNDQGSWYGFSIAEGPKVPELPNAQAIFEAAKEARERIRKGEIKTVAEEPEDNLGSEDDQAF